MELVYLETLESLVSVDQQEEGYDNFSDTSLLQIITAGPLILFVKSPTRVQLVKLAHLVHPELEVHLDRTDGMVPMVRMVQPVQLVMMGYQGLRVHL